MSLATTASRNGAAPSRMAGGSAAAAAAVSTTAAREVLSFKLGREEYGIDILKVQEIRGYDNPTRIANAPAFVKGVVNLRGVIVPIVDMRIHFGLESVAYDGFTVIIVLNIRGRTVGIVVDSVSDVLDLQPGQIKPAPEFDGGVDAGHINGLGTVKQGDAERMLILMDIESLLASADMGLMDGMIH